MSGAANRDLLLWTILLGIIAAIVILHGEKVITSPYGRFSYDSLNYADVTRNILRGRGIAQSAVAFNEASLSPDTAVPLPMTSQPPLYPLLAAGLANLGMSVTTALLLISVTGMVLVIFSGIALAWQLYGEAAAMLAGFFMLAYAPLYFVTGRAWSDTLATGLALMLMSLLVFARRAPRLPVMLLLFGGITAGLAFATRYAFLPLTLLGLLVLVRPADRRCTLHSLALFLAGALLVIVPVVVRNLLLSGTLTGAPRNPSTRGLLDNLHDTYLALFGTYLGDPFYAASVLKWSGFQGDIPSDVSIVFILALFAVLILILLARGKLVETLIPRQRFLLPVWGFIYLAFLILQRTQFHFDIIRSRLVFPAGIVMILLLAALLAQAFSIRPRILIYPILLIAFFGLVQAWLEAREPAMTYQEFIDRSIADQPILDWVNKNTSPEDLIIGDDPVDLVFYLDRSSAVSFSPYPYSAHLTYENLTGFLQNHCGSYRSYYLFVRALKNSEKAWQDEFGPFITDLAMDRVAAYPIVVLRIPHDQALIYQLRCGE